MLTLGWDPSLTNFGWALVETDAAGSSSKIVGSGRWQSPARDTYVARYMGMRDTLIRQLEALRVEHGPFRVSQESPVFGGSYSEGLYALFIYASEALYSLGLDVVHWSPGQLKAHARARLERPAGWVMQKADMIEAMMLDAGSKRRNHNEADAYWAAAVGARWWAYHEGRLKVSDLSPLEVRQFTEIKQFSKGKNAGKTIKRGMEFREDDRFFLWSRSFNDDGGGPRVSSPKGC